MELYVHIPFCVKKCNYCDFLSFPGYGCDADERHRSLSCEYVDALCHELENVEKRLTYLDGNNIDLNDHTGKYHRVKSGDNNLESKNEKIRISTCFVGGGTPSVLDMEQTEKLLKSINKYLAVYSFCDDKNDLLHKKKFKEIEFTIECNPGTVTKEKLLLYRKYGVNRLSFGLQSADNGILKRLGRIHTYEEFIESFKLARECDFNNINIDLISAVPGQTIENWKDTLEKVAALSPEHISAYSLILEEGTPLYKDYEEKPDSLQLPDEDTEREIYHITKRILKENGYERYEISNYAKPGYECKHNVGYWTGEEYIGVGLGAASYLSEYNYSLLYNIKDEENENDKNVVNGQKDKNNISNETKMLRIKNTVDMDRYKAYYLYPGNFCVNGIKKEQYNKEGIRTVEEILDREAQMSEFFILGLRMCKGISKSEFTKRFGVKIEDVFGSVIAKHIEAGLLEDDEDNIRCTEKGLDLNNAVLCDFM